jgi:hypothetical protein
MKNKVELGNIELGVVVLYVIQAIGRPAAEEILSTIRGFEVHTTIKRVKECIENLRKRGLISVNIDKASSGGVTSRYSMKDLRWTNPPELAHSKAILPAILSSETAEQVRKAFDDVHEAGETKSKQGPNICNYTTVSVRFTNVVPILGGDPDEEKINRLRRSNGSVWLPLNMWLKGAIRDRLRMINETSSKAMYIHIEDLFVPVREVPFIMKSVASPSPRPGGAGTGFSVHEGIKEGFSFTAKISFPTTGFADKDKFLGLLNGIRIGARHKDYGLLKVDEVKVV